MSEKPLEICERTFQFALRIVKLCDFLNSTPGVSRELSRQLVRSGTSIGANVEESQAAQSTADFIHKLEISLKEARETRYWLRLLIAAEIVSSSRLVPLLNEANEIVKILASIIVKTKQNRKK
jgi:four helix bundle protein